MLTKFKGTELEVMLSAQRYTDHQQETLKKFRNRVLQLQLYPPKEKITFCEPNKEENDSKQFPNESVKFISLKQFKTLGRIPRYNDVHSYLEEITPEKHFHALVVYVSHRWISDKSGIWKPDDSDSNNYKLIIEGIEILWKNLAPWMEDCYLWVNHSCGAEQSLNQLSAAMDFCDCIFTPLYDEDFKPGKSMLSSFSLSMRPKSDPSEVPPNYSSVYSSPSWEGSDSSYIKQAVCRLEMFLGANIPLLNGNAKERMKKLIGKTASLYYHRKMERRPHFLYGTKESTGFGTPFCLPPLTRFNFDYQLYDPQLGLICSLEQEQLIRSFVTECPAFPPKPEPGYSGDDNHGTYVFEAGTIYEGKWLNDSFSGYFTCYYPNGDYYEGVWKDGLRHGKGTYFYNSGELFVGDWHHGNKYKGRYFYSTGDRCKGFWFNGKRNLCGTYVYFQDGCRYEGDWADGRRRMHGKCTVLSGDCFEFSWLSSAPVMPCRLKYTCHNNESYEGDWCKGKFRRSGEYAITLIGGYLLKGKYDLLGNAEFEGRATSFNSMYSSLTKSLPWKTAAAQETVARPHLVRTRISPENNEEEKEEDEQVAVQEKEGQVPFRFSFFSSPISKNTETPCKTKNNNSKKPEYCVVC
jgi:hypothetical protein